MSLEVELAPPRPFILGTVAGTQGHSGARGVEGALILAVSAQMTVE